MESKQIAVVTGSNGFVGSHLVDLLLEKNFSVRCVVRESSNLKWLEGKDIEIFKCGLFDKAGLTAALKDAGKNYIAESAMAKLYSSKISVECALEAIQIHGGYGYVREYLVERYLRDAKITEIYEGTSEIQKIVIARSLLDKK